MSEFAFSISLPPFHTSWASPEHKFLGVCINDTLTWHEHVQQVSSTVSRNLNLLRRLSWFPPKSALLVFYCSYILPFFDYCDVVRGCCTKEEALFTGKADLIRGLPHTAHDHDLYYCSIWNIYWTTLLWQCHHDFPPPPLASPPNPLII